MSEILLATKTRIPPLRSHLINRPRLIQRLNEGISQNNRVSLISAPAGFGKTTLINEWIRQTDIPSAWLSLDKGDNDPIRFITQLAMAIQRVATDVGNHILAIMQLPQPPAIDAAISVLINDIAEIPLTKSLRPSIILVLEDYHEIIADSVHDALVFLIDHLPQQLHLAVTTRVDPPWPLARLRARHEIIELRSTDLRFTPEETSSFLNGIMHLNLSPENISLLDVRTEGWIAGLQMAALSMQGREDATSFIQNFSGSHRFVLDYLVEEVLNRQSAEIQEFLLKTSILDRLTTLLCNAVTGMENSQSVLDWLEHANLFLVSLDDERQWYRYHHLFADLLRNNLGRMHPELLSVLYGRATTWYRERKLITPAISYALQANDIDEVEQLVKQDILAVIFHGDMYLLLDSISKFSDEVMHSHPWLLITYAWALGTTGRLEEAELSLRGVESLLVEIQALGEDGSSIDQIRYLQGHVSALRSYFTLPTGDWNLAIDLAQEALELLPQDDLRTRAFVTGLLASSLSGLGNGETAMQVMKEAVFLSRKVGDLPSSIHEMSQLAGMQLFQGQLNQVLTTCQEAIRLADEDARQTGYLSLAAKDAYLFAGRALYERNDLAAAEYAIRRGIELCERSKTKEEGGFVYLLLARVYQAKGDMVAALDLMNKAHNIDQQSTLWLASYDAAWTALLYLGQENLDAATKWAEESGLRYNDDVNLHTYVKHIVLARFLVMQGRFQFINTGSDQRLHEVIVLLDRLVALTEATGTKKYIIETRTVQALALDAGGNLEQAFIALERALKLAEPEGFVRTFVDEGTPMARLLQEAAARGISPTYASKLVDVLEKEGHIITEATQGNKKVSLSSTHASNLLTEPLTERELEILPFLRSSLSLAEIADHMTISVNTARSHIKHIYGKFDVHSRSAAIERAEKLGLL